MDIILDMGNVLLEWNKEKILKAVAKTQKDYLILDKVIFQSGLWERLDLGTLSREELVDKVLSLLGDWLKKSFGTGLPISIFTRKSFRFLHV